VTHTSGLPRIPLTLPMAINLFTLSITRGNPYRTISGQVIIDNLARVQEKSTSERIFRYSNYGFGLLGLIIANNYGMTYEDTMRRIITNPLGMNNTLVHADKIKKKQMATGHHSFVRLGKLNIGRQSQYWDMQDAMAGCGGIRSSGEDLLKFLTDLIEQEPPFSVLVQQPLFSINEQLAIGMAWLLQDNIVPNHRVIWHNGQTGGFNSYLGLIENERKGVFILSNLATTAVQPLGEELLRQMCSPSDQ
jgi:D-alanyl-D-alanine-carboxypeptidase/D-alanyl-D-alanine-endopeptidase